jgi:hypothetical protein
MRGPGNGLADTLLASKQRPHFWDELAGDRHQGDVLGLARRLDFGKLLVFGLVLAIRDYVLHTLLIPVGRISLLVHLRSHSAECGQDDLRKAGIQDKTTSDTPPRTRCTPAPARPREAIT